MAPWNGPNETDRLEWGNKECIQAGIQLNRVPTDLESLGIDLVRESLGILLAVRENFIYHPCFSVADDCYIFNQSWIVACLPKFTVFFCVNYVAE